MCTRIWITAQKSTIAAVSLSKKAIEAFNAKASAKFEGVVDAQISSAFPLSGAQVDDIVATLKGKYGRQVKATVTIDPELIGGVSIRVGDEVMDASVRGKLAQLADALKI